MKFAWTFLLLVAAQSSCLADHIDYSITGFLPAGLASSTMGTGNAEFTLSFSLPAQPGAVLPGINGSTFSMVTNAAFRSGSTTSLIQDAEIGFYSEAMGGGLFARLFNGTDLLHFSLGGAALFSGSGSSPAMLAGVFSMGPNLYSGVGLNTKFDAIPHGFSTASTVTASAVGVPEPGESLLSGAAVALAMLAGATLRRCRA